MSVEFGIETFGDVTLDKDGNPQSQAHVLRDVVEEARLADSLGINFFGVGEHHRDDFAISATDVVLSHIAALTKNIHLGSAVTVLSSEDPIRVFQRFSTLDALSNGRAEVIVGRGSFTESFPLFGLPLEQYEELFEEKLEIFTQLAATGEVTWQGTIRPPLNAQKVYPPVEGGVLKTWVGVGGSPQSVVRAANFGLPLVLAIIGGSSDRFVPFADLYRRALAQMGKSELPIAVHSPGHISDTDEQAREELWPGYSASFGRIGRERGWGPMTRTHFDQEASPSGALYVGSPETVAQKIAHTVRVLGLSRFDLKYANGPIPHQQLMRSIELYATKVIPRVRELLSDAS